MGEIGYDRHAYLYELSYCDLLCIERGYNRRYWQGWSMTRWQTYYTMLAQCGSKSMRESGIRKPADLIKFPWEKKMESEPPISDKEAQELIAERQAMNKKSDS